MITHKELQRFLPLDECAEIISHCLSIKEVVHTNQEIPEIQGAFVSRSDYLSKRHIFDRNCVEFEQYMAPFFCLAVVLICLDKACRWGVLYARFQHGSALCSSPVNHYFIYDKRWLVKRERVGVCLFVVECLYMNVKYIKDGEIVRSFKRCLVCISLTSLESWTTADGRNGKLCSQWL